MSTRNETGLLIARVLVGLMFVATGVFKLASPDEMAAFLATLPQFPAPEAMAWVVAVVELVGGLALVLGIKPRVAACGLAIYLALATPVHAWDYFQNESGQHITNLLKNTAIIGGLTALWAAPPRKACLLP